MDKVFDFSYNCVMRYKKDEVTAIDKICLATTRLLLSKDYHSLTNTDIINEAKVSRSTFYIYFKNKEQIVIYISDHIFDHVFSKNLYKGFKSSSYINIKNVLAKSFAHFFEEGELVLSILNSGASSIFLSRLRKRLKPLIEELIEQRIIGNNDIPLDIRTHQYINGYTSLLQYYLRHVNNLSPDLIANYYLTIYK